MKRSPCVADSIPISYSIPILPFVTLIPTKRRRHQIPENNSSELADRWHVASS